MSPRIDQQVTFLYTADLDRAAAFYEGVLNLPLALDQGACRIYRVAAAAFLGFCRQTEAIAPERAGVILTLVVDEPDAVDQWADYLVALGVAFERGPLLNERFNIYHLFLRDPDGYLIEIQAFLDPAWPRIEAPHG